MPVPTLWAFFNLGAPELLILAGMALVPLVLAGTVVLVVLLATRKKRDPDEE